MTAITWKERSYARLLLFVVLFLSALGVGWVFSPIYPSPVERKLEQDLPWAPSNLKVVKHIDTKGLVLITLSMDQFLAEAEKRPQALLLTTPFSYYPCKVVGVDSKPSAMKYVLIENGVAWTTNAQLSLSHTLLEGEEVGWCGFQGEKIQFTTRPTLYSGFINFCFWAGIVVGGLILSVLLCWWLLGMPREEQINKT